MRPRFLSLIGAIRFPLWRTSLPLCPARRIVLHVPLLFPRGPRLGSLECFPLELRQVKALRYRRYEQVLALCEFISVLTIDRRQAQEKLTGALEVRMTNPRSQYGLSCSNHYARRFDTAVFLSDRALGNIFEDDRKLCIVDPR